MRSTELARLDVVFRLTDETYAPIPHAAVRLVFAGDPDFFRPHAGKKIVTDADGSARFATAAAVDIRSKKLPTNFVDSLFSLPKRTHHVAVGAELLENGRPRLYVVELYRFADGDVLTPGFRIYSQDSSGRFSIEAERTEAGWRFADLGGALLTTSGHDVWDYQLEPNAAEDSDVWRLTLAFKRKPPPVPR